LVLATQHPIELEGTFPLLEDQVDRFLMRLGMGYPQREEERQILRRFRTANPLHSIEPVVTTDAIRAANQVCRQVHVHPVLEDYLLDLVDATRRESAFALGVSPRGTLALYRTAQALAAIRNRTHVLPDDFQALAQPVWAHRLLPAVETRLHERSVDAILAAILDRTPVPVEENWAARAAMATNDQ